MTAPQRQAMEQKDNTGISLSRISQYYGKKRVLEDVTFEAGRGAIVGITGINGGGKSTLLSILAGIRKPTGGSFICLGTDIIRERNAAGRLIGYLPQENPLIEELSAYDNLRLWYGGRVSAELPVIRQLQLEDLLQQKVRTFSGGMKRRLSIACAISQDQPVLILDEPSSSLDLHQKKIISDYILSYSGNGGIVLVSTHDREEIRLCTQVYYLEEGRAVEVDAEEAIRRLREGLG